MEARELRIGNWVKFKSPFSDKEREIIIQGIEFEELDRVYIISCDDGDVRGFERAFNPIPLTPEWLERFGFDYENSFWQCPIGDVVYFSPGLQCWIGKYNDIDTGVPLKTIQFVHSLQNLYFALMGKELQLKKHDN